MKRKFKTSEAARTTRQLEADWQAMQLKWSSVPKLSRSATVLASAAVVRGKKVRPYYSPAPDAAEQQMSLNREVKSLGSWVTGTHSSKPGTVYTGNAIVGICTMHKSNLVPVFSTEDAKDISKMRR